VKSIRIWSVVAVAAAASLAVLAIRKPTTPDAAAAAKSSEVGNKPTPTTPSSAPSDKGPRPARLLETATRDEWLAALRQRIADGASSDEILADLKFLLQRQPGLAVDVALAVARSNDEKHDWLGALLAEWSTFNADAAWARTLELVRSHAVTGEPELPAIVLGQLAKFDPDRVVIFADNALQAGSSEETAGFSGGDIAHAALRGLIAANQADLARKTLERWSGGAAAEALGNAPYEEVALEYARRSRTEAADWLRNLPPSSGRDFTLATLAADWAATAPQEAMTWAASLDVNSARSDAMQRAFNRWADTDIVAAAQWVAEHESNPQADTLIANLVGDTSLGHVAPERALQWSELIRDPAARQTAVQRVISDWSEHDPAAAARFAEQTPLLSATVRQQVLDQIRHAPKPPE
jgi:hypothetical protein